MKTTAKENLLQLKNLLKTLSESDYLKETEALSDATIGQHIRHILEFYLLLVSGSFTGTISYDKRERDLRIENSLSFALDTIDRLLPAIDTIREEDSVILEADYSTNGKSGNTIKTTAGRELAYCIEHSIHHQAIIKAGLITIGLSSLTDKYFGVAYSTIRYREN
jgi:uncharacterized damage-inducible protein DinB